ncbi:hypothetical protein GGS21DRAFT_518264 [Xylaria nigripes]|nr:hypothetical protein GGS21DRAFT_518264 [Xylaria nigripes]
MERFASALLLGQTFNTVAAQSTSLNITAIAGIENRSVIQCWQMPTPFAVSSDAGTSGVARIQLSNVSNIDYIVLPSNYDGSLHHAPANQWVAFIAGLAHITLPDDPEANAFVVGGRLGLIFAADTADVSEKGHITRYPGNTETIALQIPTKDNTIPPHSVLHSGPCSSNEVAGIHDFATQKII